jgi:MOSC domain-containing protein
VPISSRLAKIEPVHHVTAADIERALDHIRGAPADNGVVTLIVRRPAENEREILTIGELSATEGLVGDTWKVRPSRRTADGSPHPDMQLNIISSRFLAVIGPDAEQRPLAGDQLHLDFDLSEVNVPAGTRLGIGLAVIEITDEPHTGCAKFSERFGRDALRFVNSPVGRELHLRGVNARVVEPGKVRVGDPVVKLAG